MRIVLAVIVLCLGSLVFAQQVGHDLKIQIPSVMILKLTNSSDSETVPVAIKVQDGSYQINPSQTQIEVLANRDWSLNASYQAASQRDAQARLMWNTGAGWQAFRYGQHVLASGDKTGGWQTLRVDYQLDTPLPPSGTYQGVITYTLTRP